MPDIVPDYRYTGIIPESILYDIRSDIRSDIRYDMVPPLEKETAGIISSSEAILKAYTSKHSHNARAINDLIKDVQKNPAFNANEVDTDMLQRLQASIDSGDIQTINMTVEGDGEKNLELFRRPAEKVLRERMADMCLAGCQHFALH
jgi:hypothetical protein